MATTSRTKFDIRTEASKPLFATVGATDLAVEAVREFAADVHKRVTGYSADVQKSVTAIDIKPATLSSQARTAVTERVEALQKDAKARRTEVEKLVVDLQAEALAVPAKVQKALDENVSALGETYDDLVKRGESLVSRIRKQPATQAALKDAKTTVAKAKATRTSATKAAKSVSAEAKATATSTAKKATATAKKRTATTKSNAKATVTAAKKTAADTAHAVVDAAEKIGD